MPSKNSASVNVHNDSPSDWGGRNKIATVLLLGAVGCGSHPHVSYNFHGAEDRGISRPTSRVPETHGAEKNGDYTIVDTLENSACYGVSYPGFQNKNYHPDSSITPRVDFRLKTAAELWSTKYMKEPFEGAYKDSKAVIVHDDRLALERMLAVRDRDFNAAVKSVASMRLGKMAASERLAFIMSGAADKDFLDAAEKRNEIAELKRIINEPEPTYHVSRKGNYPKTGDYYDGLRETSTGISWTDIPFLSVEGLLPPTERFAGTEVPDRISLACNVLRLLPPSHIADLASVTLGDIEGDSSFRTVRVKGYETYGNRLYSAYETTEKWDLSLPVGFGIADLLLRIGFIQKDVDAFYSLQPGWESTFKTNQRPGDFLLPAAAMDGEGDFATSYALYVGAGDVFRNKAMKNPVVCRKYKMLQRLFDGAEYRSSTSANGALNNIELTDARFQCRSL